MTGVEREWIEKKKLQGKSVGAEDNIAFFVTVLSQAALVSGFPMPRLLLVPA